MKRHLSYCLYHPSVPDTQLKLKKMEKLLKDGLYMEAQYSKARIEASNKYGNDDLHMG